MKYSVLVILAVLALSAGPQAPAQNSPSSESAAAERGGVPLGQLLESVAKRTGRSFLVDPRVSVTLPVHLFGQDIAKVDYGELLAILNLSGFTALEEDGYVHVIPNAEIRQRAIPLVKGGEHLPSAQYVTAVIRVKSVQAAQLVPILRPLLPQVGHLAALPCTNTMLIVDTQANVRRIKAVIEALDTGEPLPPEKCEHN